MKGVNQGGSELVKGVNQGGGRASEGASQGGGRASEGGEPVRRRASEGGESGRRRAARMKTMFTDQDDAIAAAILLTNICDKHRLCLWHILMNMTKHMGKVLGTDFDGLRNAIVALASHEYGNSTTAW